LGLVSRGGNFIVFGGGQYERFGLLPV
jgi:hypothetical protein